MSELQLKWDSGTNSPDTLAKFADARADYSQSDFPVKQAIDGKVWTANNGWAIGGAPSVNRHTATFKLEQPISATNGIKLRFVLKQHYGDDFLLGRFRLYVTSSDDPLDFGYPESIVQAARAPGGERTPEQSLAILEFYRNTDKDFWKPKHAAITAADPLPTDQKLAVLQTTLNQAQEPVHLDPGLVQLREDAKDSGLQNKNKRLTVVQDLTWALVNSPGFLFNH